MNEKQLYKGVFWIADLENIGANRAYCFKIPCDVQGYPAENSLNLNAKSGLTYNHRLLWEMLNSKLTGGKKLLPKPTTALTIFAILTTATRAVINARVRSKKRKIGVLFLVQPY